MLYDNLGGSTRLAARSGTGTDGRGARSLIDDETRALAAGQRHSDGEGVGRTVEATNCERENQ